MHFAKNVMCSKMLQGAWLCTEVKLEYGFESLRPLHSYAWGKRMLAIEMDLLLKKG